MSELVQKIAKVSEAIGPLQTDKRNQQQKYDYISADQVLTVANREMAKVGLVVIPALVDEKIESVEYKTGNWRYDCRVDFEMTIADGEGHAQTMVWFGRGSDYSVPDKAMYKAITSGHKYFLMKLFNIGVGNDDGEHENEPQQKPAKQVPQPAPNGNGGGLSDSTRKKLHAVGKATYGDDWESKRADMSAAFNVGSSNQWTENQAQRVISGMQKILNERVTEPEQVDWLDEPQPVNAGAYAE